MWGVGVYMCGMCIACKCSCMYMHMCVLVYVCTCTCVYLCMCVHAYVCTCVCVYMHMCVCYVKELLTVAYDPPHGAGEHGLKEYLYLLPTPGMENL